MNYLSQINLSFFSHQFILIICIFITFFIFIIFIYLFFFNHNNTIFNSNFLLEYFCTFIPLLLVVLIFTPVFYFNSFFLICDFVFNCLEILNHWFWNYFIYSFILIIVFRIIFFFFNNIYYRERIIKFFKSYAGFRSRHSIFYSIIIFLLYFIICIFAGSFLEGFLFYFSITILFTIITKLFIILFCYWTRHPYPFSDVTYKRLHSFYFYINERYDYYRSRITFFYLVLCLPIYSHVSLNLIGLLFWTNIPIILLYSLVFELIIFCVRPISALCKPEIELLYCHPGTMQSLGDIPHISTIPKGFNSNSCLYHYLPGLTKEENGLWSVGPPGSNIVYNYHRQGTPFDNGPSTSTDPWYITAGRMGGFSYREWEMAEIIRNHCYSHNMVGMNTPNLFFIYYFLGHNSRNAEYVKFLSSVPLQYYKYHGSEQVLSNVQGFYLKLNETWLVSTWARRINSPYSRYPLPTVAPITLDSLEDCGALTRNCIVISPGLQFELSTCSAWVDFISNPLDLEGVPRGSTIPVGELLSVLSPM